jgi:hypothetical protein
MRDALFQAFSAILPHQTVFLPRAQNREKPRRLHNREKGGLNTASFSFFKMSFKKLRVMFMLPIAVLMFALGWLFLWIDDLQRLKKGRLVISAHKGMALTIEKNADNSATIHKA